MGKLHFGAPLLGALFITGLGLAACSSDPVVVSPPGSGGAGSGGAGGEAPSCVDGETLCGDACAATDSDVAHCGACGNACAPGEVCSEGSCAIACPAGQTVCGDACVDLDADRAHCGACDSACDDPCATCDGSRLGRP